MYTRRALLAACIILLACHGPRQATVVPAPSQPEGAATAADSHPLPVDAAIDANPALPGFDETGSDREAIEIADGVMARLGGRRNWDNTRYITWRFFGRRLLVWDKWTGNIRFESKGLVVLMNINSQEGRAWDEGVEVADPDTLSDSLRSGYRAWINDAYWLVMPYKLKDSGVTLRYKERGMTEDGIPADVLELTFTAVGITPQNKYDVYVDVHERLVRQWAFYRDAADEEPAFVDPWKNWKQYGRIWLADGHGRNSHTDVAVFDDLPAAVFESPEVVDMMSLTR